VQAASGLGTAELHEVVDIALQVLPPAATARPTPERSLS
jgi:hypothetical protein